MNVDLASLILRLTVGFVLLAHGYNHVFRGGKIAGTARWFESIGIRPGRVHAVIASAAEIAGGIALMLGAGTPLAAASVVGTMTVAFVANHRSNGFFIFRPGEGYEYVMTLIMAGLAIAALGPGRFSVDHLLDLSTDGWPGLITALVAGGGGALALLAVSWRPKKEAA